MALLGLALAAATESSTDDLGSTKVTDGTLNVNYCGERCEYDWECRRGNRCHECRKQHHEVSVPRPLLDRLLTMVTSAMAAAANDMTELKFK
ncbi:hypothetical protein AtubIFM57258_004718 [Aspergillus tubingensis]|nr:hypothetical protein AtubIFM57258_004718 [Aspergillus tubingensis]